MCCQKLGLRRRMSNIETVVVVGCRGPSSSSFSAFKLDWSLLSQGRILSECGAVRCICLPSQRPSPPPKSVYKPPVVFRDASLSWHFVLFNQSKPWPTNQMSVRRSSLSSQSLSLARDHDILTVEFVAAVPGAWAFSCFCP
jgi:hypothetical protein